MKYKRRSLKKKRQQPRKKKYTNVQRGGGFMDVIAELNAMEGRTYTRMAVHPTQPLVAVGDDAGTVMLFKIISISAQQQPKRVAQLMGLSKTVECVEFHPTLPVVAAACSDSVLIWEIGQIIGGEEQQKEQQVQQLEPSHTVISDDIKGKIKNDAELKAIYEATLDNLEIKDVIENGKAEHDKLEKAILTLSGRIYANNMKIQNQTTITREWDTILQRYIERPYKPGEKEELDKELKKELITMEREVEEMTKRKNILLKQIKEANEMNVRMLALEEQNDRIRKGVKNDISCFAFHPNKPYIAVALNTSLEKIGMYHFDLSPPPTAPPQFLSSFPSFSFSPEATETLSAVRRDPQRLYFFTQYQSNPIVMVSFVSFSRDGEIFVYGDKNRKDIIGRIFSENIRRFYEKHYNTYPEKWWDTYRLLAEPADLSHTCISSIKSEKIIYPNETHHTFMIGYSNGSLKTMLIKVSKTQKGEYGILPQNNLTFSTLKSGQEPQQPVFSVAVHPSLPFFASGSLHHAKLWSFEKGEALELVPLQNVKSVGFNESFWAACDPRGVHVYNCDSSDFKEYMEEYKKRDEISKFLQQINIKDYKLDERADICPICQEPMHDPTTHESVKSGVDEEKFLDCDHKFHTKCIQKWFDLTGRQTCPVCRKASMIVKQTPQRFANDPRRSETLQARAAELSEKQRESVIAGIQRLVKYEPRPRALFSSPLSSPVSTSQSAAAAAASPQRPQLTIQQLRDARNAYFGVGQQQRQNEQPPPPESSGGGKRKYSRKKNNSKKSKFRRRYSKKYKY
jgi:hypothetical protein